MWLKLLPTACTHTLLMQATHGGRVANALRKRTRLKMHNNIVWNFCEIHLILPHLLYLQYHTATQFTALWAYAIIKITQLGEGVSGNCKHICLSHLKSHPNKHKSVQSQPIHIQAAAVSMEPSRGVNMEWPHALRGRRGSVTTTEVTNCIHDVTFT